MQTGVNVDKTTYEVGLYIYIHTPWHGNFFLGHHDTAIKLLYNVITRASVASEVLSLTLYGSEYSDI